MKNFIFMFMTMFCMVFGTAFAQEQTNYAGSSKASDNWSVTAQVGFVTPFNDFMKNNSVTPIVVLGVNKEINPWFAVELEGRTSIGTGWNYNNKTAFDMVNVNGYIKFNIRNMFAFDGTRHMFEPVVYTGIGWVHNNPSSTEPAPAYWPSDHIVGSRNMMSYRVGAEFNFNLGEKRAWGIVVNPSVVWGNPCNARLDVNNASFELSAGVVYRFNNSNGKRSFSRAKLYDQVEVDRLNAEIKALNERPAQVVEKVVEKVTVVNAPVNVWAVAFTHNSAELSDNAKLILNSIEKDATVTVDAYASREPMSNDAYNVELSNARANAVKAYLESRNVKVDAVNAHGCDDNFGRVAVVTVK